MRFRQTDSKLLNAFLEYAEQEPAVRSVLTRSLATHKIEDAATYKTSQASLSALGRTIMSCASKAALEEYDATTDLADTARKLLKRVDTMIAMGPRHLYLQDQSNEAHTMGGIQYDLDSFVRQLSSHLETPSAGQVDAEAARAKAESASMQETLHTVTTKYNDTAKASALMLANSDAENARLRCENRSLALQLELIRATKAVVSKPSDDGHPADKELDEEERMTAQLGSTLSSTDNREVSEPHPRVALGDSEL